jgi:hypothetical protein
MNWWDGLSYDERIAEEATITGDALVDLDALMRSGLILLAEACLSIAARHNVKPAVLSDVYFVWQWDIATGKA